MDGGGPKHQLCAFRGARTRENTIINRVRSIGGAVVWPLPFGFGLGGRLLLARRGRVYVKFIIKKIVRRTGPRARSTSPHAAEFGFYFRGCAKKRSSNNNTHKTPTQKNAAGRARHAAITALPRCATPKFASQAHRWRCALPLTRAVRAAAANSRTTRAFHVPPAP